jgi:hypothetical protein
MVPDKPGADSIVDTYWIVFNLWIGLESMKCPLKREVVVRIVQNGLSMNTDANDYNANQGGMPFWGGHYYMAY